MSNHRNTVDLPATSTNDTKLLEREDDLGYSLSLHQAMLVVVEGPHEGERLLLNREQLHIGREVWCDLCLSQDQWISAVHCLVRIDQGRVRIQDLRSSNGVFFEGTRIYDICLREGGRIQMGSTVLELRVSSTSTQIDVAYCDGSGELLGRSKAMRKLFAIVERIAGHAELSVLLQGETGTGKTVLAKSIHLQSQRPGRFVTVDCSVIPDGLIESELFGHKKNAFTGATQDKSGLIAEADGGTLFIDEIGNMSLDTQQKLLRVLESKSYRRLGGNVEQQSDFRLITATHRDLKRAVMEGAFREDLYYRISTMVLELPPLRERLEDIPLLSRQLLAKGSSGEPCQLSADALQALQRHLWPGNIRELRNVLTKARAFSNGHTIHQVELETPHFWLSLEDNPPSQTDESLLSDGDEEAIPPESSAPHSDVTLRGDGFWVPFSAQAEDTQLKSILEDVTRIVLQRTLDETGDNVEKAAHRLGISRGWCFTLVKRHKLK